MNPLKYFSVRGRASRRQYWRVALVTLLLAYPGWFILTAFFAGIVLQKYGQQHINFVNYTASILWLLFIVPFYTTSVRRCRDAGISLWWVLLLLVPIIGFIPMFIVAGCLRSYDSLNTEKRRRKKPEMLKYISFYGKASRQQYWAIGAIGVVSFVLLFPIYFLLGGVIALIFQEFNFLWGVEHVKIFGFATVFAFGVLSAFLFLLTSVRRCRDARISLWLLLLWFVPFVNIVFLIALGCLRSSDT